MRKGTAATLVCLTLAAGEAWAGQSLGQLAAAEAARRKAITEPARVITQEELPAGPPAPVPEAPASPDAGDDPRPALVRSPARLRGGGVPQQPQLAVSGGEVALELSVSADRRGHRRRGAAGDAAVHRGADRRGQVVAIRAGHRRARAAAPARRRLPPAAPWRRGCSSWACSARRRCSRRRWARRPRRSPLRRKPVPAPRAFPPMPVFPPNVLFDGVVLAELRVGADGALGQTRIVQSAAAFDRPTHRGGERAGLPAGPRARAQRAGVRLRRRRLPPTRHAVSAAGRTPTHAPTRIEHEDLRHAGGVARVAGRAPPPLRRRVAALLQEVHRQADPEPPAGPGRGALLGLDRRPGQALRRRQLAAALHAAPGAQRVVEAQPRAGRPTRARRPDAAERPGAGGGRQGRRPLGSRLRLAVGQRRCPTTSCARCGVTRARWRSSGRSTGPMSSPSATGCRRPASPRPASAGSTRSCR